MNPSRETEQKVSFIIFWMIVIFAITIKALEFAIAAFKLIKDERKNMSIKALKQSLTHGFRNLLGLRNKRNLASHATHGHAHKNKAITHFHHFDLAEFSSDSEENLSSESEENLNDSNEHKASTQIESKPQSKIRPGRKNWGRGNIHKSLLSPARPLKLVTSNTQTTKTCNEVYELHNMHGNLFARLTVNPKLTEYLDITEKRVLNSLCVTGRVIEGDSKGRKGWITLAEPETKKSDSWGLKGKDAGHDFRFYSTKKEKAKKKIPDYYCTGFRASHKNHSPIIRFK